jgi:hypothetical protein
LSPGSTFERDDSGFLVVNVANAVSGTAVFNSLTPALTWAMITRQLDPVFQTAPTPPERFMIQNMRPRGPDQVARVIAAFLGPNSGLAAVPLILNPLANWVASPDGLQTQAPIARGSAIWSVNFTGERAMPQPPIAVPIGRMVQEIEKAAYQARAQQRDDAASIDRHNAAVRKANDRIVLALAAALGSTPGQTRSELLRWWTDQRGYALPSRSLASRTTVFEEVALDYTPQSIGRILFDRQVGYYTPPSSSCFGAGTLVRTREGLRAIETIKIGDSLLSQDPRNGALSYQPVVNVLHNPPAATLKISLEIEQGKAGETVVATPIHRFWKAQSGWVMARDLKLGDAIRTLGGAVRVASMESGATLPVFNLEVAGGHDFFVGAHHALVHDHSIAEPVIAPFDSPVLAAVPYHQP